MDTYRRYREARDAAWRALLQLRDKHLPVDAEALAGQLGVEVHPFPGAGEDRLLRCIRLAGGGNCVSLRIQGQWHIFLRQDRLDDSQRRFSVAHELGHLLLRHGTRSLMPGVRAFNSRDNQGDLIVDVEDPEDYAADIFAIRLLAPACLLHEMHVDQSGRIMALCGMPPRAAAFRAERMALLNERNAFYTHSLERQVRDQFLPFLRSCQAAGALADPSPADNPRSRLLSPLPQAVRESPAEDAPANDPDPLPVSDEAASKNEVPSPAGKTGLGGPWAWLTVLALAAILGTLIFFLCHSR